MNNKAVYKSPKRASFEAWLRDGIYCEQDGLFRILSQQEAKDRIKEFVEKKDYASVKGVADQLRSPTTISDKSASKSLRVPFVTYAKLVESALKQKTSLSATVRNSIVQDLEEFLVEMAKTEDVIPQRINTVQKAFQTWKADSSQPEEGPKDFYYLSMSYYPGLENELIKSIVELALEQIKKDCLGIPSVILDDYLKVDWKTTLEELSDYWPDCFEQKLRLGDKGQLVLDIEFSAYLELDMDLEEYSALIQEVMNQYGNEASEALKTALGEIDEEQAMETEELSIYFALNLLSIPLAIRRGALSVNDLIVKDVGSGEEIKGQYKQDIEKQLTTLRSKLEAATKQENWRIVSAISDELVRLEKEYRLREYCLEIALKLFGKTQVISIRAPEAIIRAWEAYGKMELERVDMGK